jgi:hypothetical protein
MSKPTILQEPPDLSLVLGGPLFQIFRRTHLSGPALELLQRRALSISLFAWLPLAILTAIEGHFRGGQSLTFVGDIESHVRFLVALPLLLAAELAVHSRIRPVVRLFVERRIISAEEMPRFYAAIEAASRARNSLWLELALLVFVYVVGHLFWEHKVALGAATWYASPDATGIHLTVAGYWYSFVSIPIFQFIFLRWYLRLGIWFLFLWRTSRLRLRLLPAHPDRSGGIGFLGGISYAFAPVLLAQGTLVAGLVASRIFYQQQSLMSFKTTIIILAGFFVLLILGPLVIFTPHLVRARMRGVGNYGNFATAYVSDFDEKWFQGPPKSRLLGTTDIQSLADLANSYAVVNEMRLVPFTLKDMARLAIVTVLPIVPLLLTIMPLEELLARVVKLVF